MATASNTERDDALTALAELPGIGPSKAKWLKAAGIGDIDALRDAPLETLAHVRGVGFVLARRLKEQLGAPVPPEEEGESADETGAKATWGQDMTELRSAIDAAIAELRENPDGRGLKSKFVAEIDKIADAVADIPLDNPPDDAAARVKIAKHAKALRTLLQSAVKLDSRGKNHRKILRDKLRERRKKLRKWT